MPPYIAVLLSVPQLPPQVFMRQRWSPACQAQLLFLLCAASPQPCSWATSFCSVQADPTLVDPGRMASRNNPLSDHPAPLRAAPPTRSPDCCLSCNLILYRKTVC